MPNKRKCPLGPCTRPVRGSRCLYSRSDGPSNDATGMGSPKTTPETPATLEAAGRQLRALGDELVRIADQMRLAGADEVVNVLFGPGFAAELRDTVRPFVADARKKADRAIEAAKRRRRRR